MSAHRVAEILILHYYVLSLHDADAAQNLLMADAADSAAEISEVHSAKIIATPGFVMALDYSCRASQARNNDSLVFMYVGLR